MTATGAPSASSAGAPRLPHGCKQATGYANGKYYYVETEVCIQGGDPTRPHLRFWSKCQHYIKGSSKFTEWHWAETTCWVNVKYTLSKDGQTVKQDDHLRYWSSPFAATPRHHDVPYQCEGNGEYRLTATVSTGEGRNADAVVTREFDIRAKGC